MCVAPSRPARRASAFTLVELLVVIAVIAVLISMLLPTLGRMREAGRAVVCASNLRQIGVAFTGYLNVNDGYAYPFRNWGRWNDPANPLLPISPAHGEAYWGVAYAKAGGLPKETFNCPSAKDTDPASSDGTFAAGNVYNCYGLNGFGGVNSAFTDNDRKNYSLGPRDIALFSRLPNGTWVGRNYRRMKNAAETIVAQDAYEALLDGSGDTFDNWYQWPGKEKDYLRHQQNTVSNVLFADLHVATMNRQQQSNYRYYGGWK